MLPENTEKRNLVTIETNRVTDSIVSAYAIDAITEQRSVSFIERIGRIPKFATELEFLCALYRIEDEFSKEISGKAPCTRCGGLGYIIVYHGYDTPDRYVITDSDRSPCPCCGG